MWTPPWRRRPRCIQHLRLWFEVHAAACYVMSSNFARRRPSPTCCGRRWQWQRTGIEREASSRLHHLPHLLIANLTTRRGGGAASPWLRSLRHCLSATSCCDWISECDTSAGRLDPARPAKLHAPSWQEETDAWTTQLRLGPRSGPRCG